MRKFTHFVLLMVLFGSLQVVAQNRIVTGKVSSASDGGGLPGVSVKLKGTTSGTITNASGDYELSVPGTQGTLVFSGVGLRSQEVAINGRNVITVSLEEDDELLNEVVVVGYGTQNRKLSTQSISSIDSKTIRDIPALSPQQLLQGQAAGVQMVTSSGLLGSNPIIRIRGVASITGGGQPLFVVDGVPLNDNSLTGAQGGGTGLNPLMNINPNDIESMSVLKDAAAVSIYGSRGANGVILINTKKGGRDSKTQFTFDAISGVNEPTGVLKVMSASQFEGFVNASRTARGLAKATIPTDGFDWVNGVLRKGNINQYNLSARGGSKNTSFYVAGTYGKESGFTIGNDLNRLAGRLNLEHKANDRLTFGTNLSMSTVDMNRIGVENNTYAPLTSSYLQLPNVQPRDAQGNFVNTGFIQNVLGLVALNDNLFTTRRMTGNAYASYRLFKDLTLKTDFGMDNNFGDTKTREVNLFTPGGVGYRLNNSDRKWLNTTTLNYVKDINRHSFGALLGYSYETSKFTELFAEGKGFASDDLRNVSSAANPTAAGEFVTEWGLESQFLRANYGFDNKYVLEASVRRDGSSRFGSENRYGIFYAVSGGWVVSNEKFFNKNGFMNFLKLTASYGTAGNDRIGNFSSLGLYAGGTASDYLGSPGLRPDQVPYPALTWEETAQLDLGISTSLFNNLFTLNANYYDKITSGLLLRVPYPFTTGFTGANQNVGKMSNRGVDLDLKANVVNGKNFDLSFGFNAGFLQNRILELPASAQIDANGDRFISGSAAQRGVVGRSLNEFYVVRAQGVNPQTGNFEWINLKGEPTTTYSQADRQYIGSAIPRLVGGFTTDARFYNFDFNMLWSFSEGNMVLIDGLRFTDQMNSAGFNKSVDLLNYWQKPGDNAFAPALNSPTAGLFHQLSSFQIQDGSFLRLRNISLGYSLPQSLLAKTKVFNRARLYVLGQNLFLLKNKNFRGPDPEVSANGPNNQVVGESFFALPQAKAINFGINIGF